MHLLHSTTLELTEFFDSDLPPYAILSHTWDEDEVSYQEMKMPTSRTREKAGYAKIQRTADLAKSNGCEYVWVDTCCIDKSSSAELTEAINSMYKWYKRSKICFAFLSDVVIDSEWRGDGSDMDRETIRLVESLILSCRWVTRGWTLQELIAPTTILFYGSNSNYLGDKVLLRHALYQATGISLEILASGDPSSVSVADRMSWASERKTTRVEDIAYCLMGIFDVNMPLLYGEEGGAFIRLQEEILKSSDDHSLFAWRASANSKCSYRGLLARGPDEFRRQHGFDSILPIGIYYDHPTFVTNKGIQMTIPLVPWPKAYHAMSSNEREPHKEKNAFEAENLFVAILNCNDDSPYRGIGIVLVRLEKLNHYARADADLFLYLSLVRFEFETIFVRQEVRLSRNYYSSRLFAFEVDYHGASDVQVKTFGSHNMSLVFNKEADHNVFELCSLNGSRDISKVLSFRFENSRISAMHSFVHSSTSKTASEIKDFWRKSGLKPEIARRGDTRTGAVKIVMECNKETRSYGFKALYSPDESLDEVSKSAYRVEWDCKDQLKHRLRTTNMRERLVIPLSGPLSCELHISMCTILKDDHPVISVTIKECLVETDGPS